MSRDWWVFHTEGDQHCDACAILPVPCEVCDRGLIHTQFAEDLTAIEGKCDNCQRIDVPALVAVG